MVDTGGLDGIRRLRAFRSAGAGFRGCDRSVRPAGDDRTDGFHQAHGSYSDGPGCGFRSRHRYGRRTCGRDHGGSGTRR